MLKSNKVVKSRVRFKYQPPFADPFADIIANLERSPSFSQQLIFFFSCTEQILNCLESALQITEPRIRMKILKDIRLFWKN